MSKKITTHQQVQTLFTVLIATLLISGCNPGESVSGIDDLIDQVPGMSLIEGADNATIVVNKNQSDANFNVLLEDLKPEASSLGGNYKAWCSQYDVAINSDNFMYQGAKVYNIANEGYWKNVVYIVNKAEDYMVSDTTLKWNEIQFAVWAMINHKQIELNEEFISRRSTQYRTAKLDNVLRILSEVEANVTGYDFTKLENEVYYVELGADVQDLIITRSK